MNRRTMQQFSKMENVEIMIGDQTITGKRDGANFYERIRTGCNPIAYRFELIDKPVLGYIVEGGSLIRGKNE